MSTFSAVPLRLRKTKTVPANGSCVKGFLAEPRQAVDAAAKIGRLDGHQDLHLRGDLQHHSASQKRRVRASRSAAS